MYSCIDCAHLDKSRKNISENPNCFRYGCNYRGPDKYICGCIFDDKHLKSSHLGCSDWVEIKEEIQEEQLPGQMNIMDFIGD